MANTENLARIEALAKDAKPRNEDDYASERQIAAQSRMAEAVEAILTKAEIAELALECDKADTDELIGHYVAAARRALGIGA